MLYNPPEKSFLDNRKAPNRNLLASVYTLPLNTVIKWRNCWVERWRGNQNHKTKKCH